MGEHDCESVATEHLDDAASDAARTACHNCHRAIRAAGMEAHGTTSFSQCETGSGTGALLLKSAELWRRGSRGARREYPISDRGSPVRSTGSRRVCNPRNHRESWPRTCGHRLFAPIARKGPVAQPVDRGWPETAAETAVEQAEVADLVNPEVLGAQLPHVRANPRAIRQRAVDCFERGVRVVGGGHCQGWGTETGQVFLHGLPVPCGASSAGEVSAASRPIHGDPARQVFQPADLPAREMAADRRDHGHEHMPAPPQPGPVSEPIVSPISVLATDAEMPVNVFAMSGQAKRESTE